DGQPSVVPVCGIPLNSVATSEAPGNALVRLPTAAAFLGRPLLLPPERTSASTTTTTSSAAMPPPIASARGDAWRGRATPFERTGGGALTCASRRCCLLFLPLGTGG